MTITTTDRGFLTTPTGPGETAVVRLDGDGLPAAGHLLTKPEVVAINAALATGRALLVRGEPGTGKSQLARAAAVVLERGFVHQAVDARTDTHDLLWTFDAVERLGKAQVLRAEGGDVREALDRRTFVQPGALWWALDATTARAQARTGGPGHCTVAGPERAEVVALIDEIDKADPSVPNALLDALGHGGFNVHGLPRVSRREGTRPLVLVTTNNERALPDAFVRRCLVLPLAVPADAVPWLLARGMVQPNAPAEAVQRKVAERVATERNKTPRGRCGPGLAEFLDLLRALHEQRPADDAGQIALLHEIAPYFLNKHVREDR
jgi:MoxR-like ATPase